MSTKFFDTIAVTSKVVHVKQASYDVYIGRPSKWGNPFTHKKSDTLAKKILPTRKEAITAYENWITIGDGKHLLNDLHELDGKTLGCWCGNFDITDKNIKCHGQILLKLLNSRQ